jgi:hypothetical protein
VITYLRRLEVEYSRSKNALLWEVVTSGRFYVREETDYDNWNGGTYGHDVIIFLPIAVLGKVPLAEQEGVEKMLCEALNRCAAGINNEHVRAVSLEMAEEADTEFQKSDSLSSRPQTNPDSLTIWKPGHIRLFISHRDTHKAAARLLSDALAPLGISAFVAHDTIQPMEDWKKEILKGLETMEVMLVFLTDDFHSSTWTNQEVGYALGRGTPIITLKLQRTDPAGFIGSEQALKGTVDDPGASALGIYYLVANKLRQRERLQHAFISAFAVSSDYNEARDRFIRMENFVLTLADDEVAEIIEAFANNDQLHHAIYLTNHYNRLTAFLKRTTGNEYEIVDKRLVRKARRLMADMDEEIPF